MSHRKKTRVIPDRPVQGHSERWKPPRDPSVPKLNRYNGYKCPSCGQAWLTVDLDPGVTPMFSRCFGTEGCRGTATSMGYPAGPPPNLPLRIEWYKPTTTNSLSHEMTEHVLKGGLMRRATIDAPDWVKRLA